MRGTTVGIVVGYAANVAVADNHLHEGAEAQFMGVMLGDAAMTTVRGNTFGRTAIGLFANDGRHTRVLGNRFAPCGAAVALTNEFAGTIEGNSIDEARSVGIALASPPLGVPSLL